MGSKFSKPTRRHDRAKGVRNAKSLPQFFKALDPYCEVKQSAGKADVTFGVEGSQISFSPAKALKRVDLLFAGQVFKKNGDSAFEELPILRAFNQELSSEDYDALSTQPLLGHQELKLHSGRYRMVFVVQDRVAGTLGAKEVEFEVQ